MSLEKTAYIASKINKNGIPDTNALFAKLVQLLNKMLKTEGDSSTVAALNALTDPMPGLIITITTGGTLTLGALTVITDDTVYFNGLIWVQAEWIQNVDPTAALTVNTTLTAAQSGMLFLVGADGKAATLPSAAVAGAGVKYAFINNGADGAYGFTVSPNAIDMIMGSLENGDVKVILSGTDDKDLVNTKATARKGDYLVIESDGVNGWFVIGGTGIWTEEDLTANDTLKNPLVVETVTDNKTLDATDSGKVFLCATDGKAFTLPSTVLGLEYTFINTAADGVAILTVSPAAADGIFGTITLASSVVQMAGTADTDVVNTKSTALKGDMIKLIGVTGGWAIVAVTGIWASGA